MAPTGVSGDFVQTSTRLVMTGNFTGRPSSGRALSDATGTKLDAAPDLRRMGSRKTATPVATGNAPTTPPIRTAHDLVRNARRWGGSGDSGSVGLSSIALL